MRNSAPEATKALAKQVFAETVRRIMERPGNFSRRENEMELPDGRWDEGEWLLASLARSRKMAGCDNAEISDITVTIITRLGALLDSASDPQLPLFSMDLLPKRPRPGANLDSGSRLSV